MTVSAFDLFTVGIGPSSSHTVGPMRAARLFVERLGREGLLSRVVRVRAELFGSLGATGKGHGSVGAVVRGLAGEEPETVDPRSSTVADVEGTGRIRLAGVHEAAAPEVILHRRRVLPFHPNGMRFTATAGDTTLLIAEYFSVGGGFVVDGETWRPPAVTVPHPYSTGAELLARCRETGLSISALTLANECATAPRPRSATGGRVVTAPTNGAAGIVPAVLHYYRRFCRGADDDGVVRFLLAATAVGSLFKENASISGAEVGCQGEVGSACSMAAAGLAEVMGGSPEQVENAAEIGIEHNLGLTCDPIGGLVQIPCIERNAVAASKAITAARMAVRGDGVHHVSLDKAIRTMRLTGRDMKSKYKETSRGGLALTVVEC
ncbi:L-serine ammonia-lyase, iron-sulfur-dependent, subunit alpha [Pseudonocardia oroxyli]|uniref:L-serine dehydratase n=1 Tax=Pseudonocardia oroxyli TaxID=366584 RepID=A0A1G7JNE6_PSEOR|nr:L-serine ammonia-lyase, iron-sulfur-dependent, subunit alpha [Pseudonocardia oroxyli]SDF26490.1 L-serine dehydratase, iron-sulfur-dependent, single chain form [Pseudonocardia oroxyli]